MLLVQRHYVAKDRIREILYPDAGDRRLREDVRARQGGAAQPRRADRGRRHRRLLRRRARLPDPPRPVRAARDRADRRRGRRGWPRHQGLGARHAGEGHHRGGAQADGVRRPRRRRTPSTSASRGSAPTSRPSTCSGPRPSSAPRSSSTTDAPAREPTTRHLQPWGVVRFSGRWYAVGWDTDRDDERIFRLSRVVGAAPTGRWARAATTIPPDTDIREIAERLAPPPPTETARVLVRPGAGAVLRRQAAAVETGVGGPDGERLGPAGAAAGILDGRGADRARARPGRRGAGTVRDEVVRRLRAASGRGTS